MTIPQAFELAFQHHQAGRLAEAEALYRQILAVRPAHFDALHLLGVIAHQVGRHELAVQLMQQAIPLHPHDPVVHSNLGEAQRARGRLEEAIASFQRAIALQPQYGAAYINLGNALREMGRPEEAVAACRRAVELQPDDAKVHNNLALALQDSGQCEEAIAAYSRALELQPDLAVAHNNLGNACKSRGRLDEAIAAYRRALEIEPGYAEAHSNLANACKERGEWAAAIAAFRRAVELQPERAAMQSNLVYSLHFLADQDSWQIAEEQKRWNGRFGEPARRFLQPHSNEREPERRLRIGYVSPDFWNHVVGVNLVPLFKFHDHRDFEVLCYSGVKRPDEMTVEFQRRAEHWRNTTGVGDEALAETIRRDGIDILVDLSQHMAGNRLPVFARQPAPMQVSFAGYPESPGIEAIGYRISDRYLESANESFPGRERVFLIDSFWCYDPCELDVEINDLPSKESGRVTFGTLNNFCKVNEPLLRLWARVLQAVPASRLVMLSGSGSHRQRTLGCLEREGIAPARVEFIEPRPRKAYLELYHRLDMVLDTYPYNGHTTSLDALWMGVPVVSLAGERPVSRAGLSQLTNLGLPELVAQTEEEYVEIATRLAGDLPRLAELRRTLRARMEASVLMDASRFARNIEAAYRAMWRRWCGETPS